MATRSRRLLRPRREEAYPPFSRSMRIIASSKAARSSSASPRRRRLPRTIRRKTGTTSANISGGGCRRRPSERNDQHLRSRHDEDFHRPLHVPSNGGDGSSFLQARFRRQRVRLLVRCQGSRDRTRYQRRDRRRQRRHRQWAGLFPEHHGSGRARARVVPCRDHQRGQQHRVDIRQAERDRQSERRGDDRPI
jgi:hypothetical protein